MSLDLQKWALELAMVKTEIDMTELETKISTFGGYYSSLNVAEPPVYVRLLAVYFDLLVQATDI